jgi:hypothetical protein
MKTRYATPPVVAVETAPTHRFPPPLYSVIFFLTQGSFFKILVCKFKQDIVFVHHIVAICVF